MDFWKRVFIADKITTKMDRLVTNVKNKFDHKREKRRDWRLDMCPFGFSYYFVSIDSHPASSSSAHLSSSKLMRFDAGCSSCFGLLCVVDFDFKSDFFVEVFGSWLVHESKPDSNSWLERFVFDCEAFWCTEGCESNVNGGEACWYEDHSS